MENELLEDDGMSMVLAANDWMRLEHYDGEVILEYSEYLHAYTVVIDGVRTRIAGVTDVVGTLDKSGPLTMWAANKTVEYVMSKLPLEDTLDASIVKSALLANYKVYKEKLPWEDLEGLNQSFAFTVETKDLARVLNEARFNFREISKEATDIGHIAHSWLERYIKLGIATGVLEMIWELPTNEKAANCVRAALQWFDRHKVRPVFSEQKLFSRKFGYSGTMDWEGYVTACDDPLCCDFVGERFELGDFKSSRALYDEYILQESAYVIASEEEFPERPIEGCRLLRLGKDDGEFESRSWNRDIVNDAFDAFLGLLQAYHWQAQRDMDAKFEKHLAKLEARAEKEAAKAAEKLAKQLAKAEAREEKERLVEEEREEKARVKAEVKAEKERLLRTKAEQKAAEKAAKALLPKKDRRKINKAVVHEVVEPEDTLQIIEDDGPVVKSIPVKDEFTITVDGEEAA